MKKNLGLAIGTPERKKVLTLKQQAPAEEGTITQTYKNARYYEARTGLPGTASFTVTEATVLEYHETISIILYSIT